jgi:hypothetical protein
MTSPIRSLHAMRLILRQQTYIAVAVAIYAALWAADHPVPIGSTLIYTLSHCNLIVLMQDHLGFLYNRKRLLHSWALYLPLLLVVSVLGVMVVNMIQFPVRGLPRQTLWNFLASGWKFPFMATVIVGVSLQFYRQTRELLESKNRELQCSVVWARFPPAASSCAAASRSTMPTGVILFRANQRTSRRSASVDSFCRVLKSLTSVPHSR